MTIDLQDDADAPKPPKPRLWRRPGRFIRSHWVFSSLLLAALIAGGAYTWSQVRPFVSSEYRNVTYSVPDAPQLKAGPGETVYRIDPTKSDAAYGVDETFVGAKANHAVGTTHGIAGDLAVNAADPKASRVGEVVVNLEQLQSDNSLRDARIRAGFLDSHDHPLAKFTTTSLTGLPAKISDGTATHFKMVGQLTIATVTAPVTWNVSATVADGRLTATATTNLEMSTFKIGPITIAGLLSTKDNVSLTMHLVALDPTRYAIPNQIAAPVEVVAQKNGPSFAKDVMPVLQAHCASCHNAGQVGASHWQMDTAADASKTAASIGLTTTAKYMPPWPASNVGVPLAHSKALDAGDIKMLSDWASAGGPLDVAPTTKIKPTDGSKITIHRDVVLKMSKSYTGSETANPNDYRCFILQPGFTSPTYVTGYQFSPDQIQEIHHAQVFHMPPSALAGSQAQDGADGKPGWSCYTGPGLIGFGGGSGGHGAGGAAGGAGAGAGAGRSAGNSGYGLMAGWAPGQDPVNYPTAGVLFQPGDYLVLQIHYHYSEPAIPDRSTLALQTAPGASNLPQVKVVNPLAPVEIPCAPADQAAPLCDRNNALADDQRLYGAAGSFIEPGLLRACGKTPEQLTADFTGTIAKSSCDSRVPLSGSLIEVMGHMHTLGKSFRMILDPDTPQQKVLLDIPTWNFDWQMVYQLKTPIHVTRGETVRIECTWDRSLDPTRAPKYIVFAEGTEDEMCFNTYSVVADPTTPGDTGVAPATTAPASH